MLLIEVARADGQINADEERVVEAALRTRSTFTEDELTTSWRFSRRAQLIATCLGGGRLADSAAVAGCFAAPIPRCAGVTAARSLLCGANTPC